MSINNPDIENLSGKMYSIGLTSNSKENPMELIKLTITPEGNEAGERAEIAIALTSGESKSRYFSMAQSIDGEFHITSKPITGSGETINQIYELGKRLIRDTTNTARNKIKQLDIQQSERVTIMKNQLYLVWFEVNDIDDMVDFITKSTVEKPMCVRTVDSCDDVYALVIADTPFSQEEADAFARAEGLKLIGDDDDE